MKKILYHIGLIVLMLILLFHSLAITAQNHQLTGKVIDKETLTGIPHANIVVLGTNRGGSTNDLGEFTLSVDVLPVNLIVSHIAYETRRIWIEMPSSPFTIVLKPVVKMLGEVEVKARNEPVPFFRDEKYSVLDYELNNDLVYLLIYKFRIARSELLCKTIFGDTVATSGTLHFKPTSLFLDCLGCLHVLSPDSAYQVFLVDESMKIGYVYGIRKFQSTMLNCVASTDDRLFFRSESPDHLTVNFYQVNRKTSQKQNLASVSDREMLQVLRQNPMDQYYLTMETIPDDFAMFEWVWVKKIMYKPNVSVLHKLGDSLAVFSTTDATLDIYDLAGKYVSGLALPVREAGGGDWTKEIYIDEFTRSPYTSFTKNGFLTIYHIDKEDGKLMQILKTAHSYPQKVRIHHNHLFYLYDVPGEGDNKHLFMQKL